jgi:Protein of unknown function (DUF1573)
MTRTLADNHIVNQASIGLKLTRVLAVAGAALALSAGLAAAQQAGQPAEPTQAVKVNKSITQLSEKEVAAAMAQVNPNPGVAAQPGAAAQVAPAVTAALKFAKATHDFGDISDTQVVEHDVEFTNITDKTITLAVAASCGCTVAAMEKTTFAPGESGKAKASFNPQGRTGAQTKTLTFTVTNPQGMFSQQTFNITSNVKALVTIDPPKLFASEVDHKSGKKDKLTIIGRKPGFQVTSVNSSSEFIKATVGDSQEVDMGGEKLTQVRIDLDIGKGAPIGALNGNIVISTNDEKAKLNPFYVGADVVGDVKCTPAQAILRVNTTSTPFSADVRIDSRSGGSFKVTSIDVEARKDMNVAADVTPGPGGAWYMLTISGTTPAEAGMVQGTVIVTTDANGGETLRVPFTAAVARPAQPSAAAATGVPRPVAAPVAPMQPK